MKFAYIIPFVTLFSQSSSSTVNNENNKLYPVPAPIPRYELIPVPFPTNKQIIKYELYNKKYKIKKHVASKIPINYYDDEELELNTKKEEENIEIINID